MRSPPRRARSLRAAHEANRASAEASLWAFDFSAVRPWTKLIVCAVNHQHGPDFPGQRAQFRDRVWRDRLAESEIDQRLLQQKVISPNEAREKRNLPPDVLGKVESIERGDDHIDVGVSFAEHDRARLTAKLVRDGFLNAMSVGILPRKTGTEKVNGVNTPVIRESELLEVSIVPVGSDPRHRSCCGTSSG